MIGGIPNRPLYFYQKDIIDGFRKLDNHMNVNNDIDTSDGQMVMHIVSWVDL